MLCNNGAVAAFSHLADPPGGSAMKRVTYRRMPEKQPRAIALAKTAPKISVPAAALIAAGALALIASLALRGLL